MFYYINSINKKNLNQKKNQSNNIKKKPWLEDKNVLRSVILIVFKNIFYSKIYQNNIFLFKKNYF